MTTKLEDSLLDIIVCPIDREPLNYSFFESADEPILYNTRLKVAYEIKDSIPVLLEEETQPLNDESLKILEKNTIRTTGTNS